MFSYYCHSQGEKTFLLLSHILASNKFSRGLMIDNIVFEIKYIYIFKEQLNMSKLHCKIMNVNDQLQKN